MRSFTKSTLSLDPNQLLFQYELLIGVKLKLQILDVGYSNNFRGTSFSSVLFALAKTSFIFLLQTSSTLLTPCRPNLIGFVPELFFERHCLSLLLTHSVRACYVHHLASCRQRITNMIFIFDIPPVPSSTTISFHIHNLMLASYLKWIGRSSSASCSACNQLGQWSPDRKPQKKI